MRATGVALLDQVLGGAEPGLPLMIAGPIGSGRTLLSLELARAALQRGDQVVYLTPESWSVLSRQAEIFGDGIERAIRERRLVLLQLRPDVAGSLRAHGAAPLVSAIRDEAPTARLVVVDGLHILFEEILDPQPLRAAVETLLSGYEVPEQLCVVTIDVERLRRQPGMERALCDVCGALVELSREETGRRWLTVLKSRLREAPGRVEFRLGAGGSRIVDPSDSTRDEPGSVAAPEVSEPTAPAAPLRESVADEHRVEVREREEDGEPVEAGRPRVLVADADAASRQQLVRWLSPRFEVEAVCDGVEALSALLHRAPALLILDLELPRVSGYEVLHACQQSRRFLPTLVLSSRLVRTTDRIRPLVLGASDLLRKPPTRLELLHRIEALLRRRPDDCETPPSRSKGSLEDLLLVASASRRLEEAAFRERAARAVRFGDRFDVPSCLLGIEVDEPGDLDAILTAAESTLRAEDAFVELAERRALLLLVAAGPEHAERVLERLLSRARGRGRGKRRISAPRWVTLPLESGGDDLDLEKPFLDRAEAP
ncbi:MAG: response regulator [Myxococcota bacterium]